MQLKIAFLFWIILFGCSNENTSTFSEKAKELCRQKYCVTEISEFDEGFYLSPIDAKLTAQDSDGNIVSTNTLLVKFDDNASSADIKKVLDEIDGKVSAFIPDVNIFEIRFESDSVDQIEKKLQALLASGIVEYAEKNYAYFQESLDIENDLNNPNLYGLWGFDEIQLVEAYSFLEQKGILLQPTKIAVLDSGFSLSLEEFSGLDVEQYDFIDVDFDVSTVEGHGTAVAGIILAQNNGIGINGIAFNADFLAYRTASDLKEIHYSFEITMIAAIHHSVKHGVKVISTSTAIYRDKLPILLHEAIKEAFDHNVTIVASAGNDKIDSSSHYPSAFPEVISVGSINNLGRRSDFSNFSQNDNVDVLTLAAPGENVLVLDLNGYRNSSGTSFAQPFVAGLAGLLLMIDSSLTPIQVRQIMVDSADEIQVTYPDGSAHVWKRINIENAVKMLVGDNNKNIDGFGKVCLDDSECDNGLICLVGECSAYCYSEGQAISPEVATDCVKSNCFSTCPSDHTCVKVEDVSYNSVDGISLCIRSCVSDSDCNNYTFCIDSLNNPNGICHFSSMKFGRDENEVCGDLIKGFVYVGCKNGMICTYDESNIDNIGHCK